MSTSHGSEWQQASSKAAHELRDKAEEARDVLASKVQTVASEQKLVISDEMARFSRAIGQAAEQLRNDQRPTAASYTADVANLVNEWADTFRETEFADAMASVQRSARQHPFAFVGGAVMAGLAAGRLLRVAAGNSHSEAHDSGETAGQAGSRDEEAL